MALYSYTARAYTAALYSIQPIHYTALYADPLPFTVTDLWNPIQICKVVLLPEQGEGGGGDP